MRLRAILFVLIACAGVGWGAQRLGEAAALQVEATTRAQVAEGLAAAGEDWASVATDGLIVTLAGAAPDEARRLRAAEIVKRIVAPRRLDDATTLADAGPPAPPPVALEILRRGDAVSAIGLAPETVGRAAVAAALAEAGLDAAFADMIESVAAPPPRGWEAALAFALDAVLRLPEARVSVAPGAVGIAALAADAAGRAALEAELAAQRPPGVALALEIDAPRPTIAPFRLDVALTPDGLRVFACSAETAAGAARIAAAAGLAAADCAIGLGAPGPAWPHAAALGLAALRDLGGGRFALTDLEATLTAAASASQAQVRKVAAALDAALPEPFSLRVAGGASEPAPVAAAAPGAPRFAAALAPDGALTLSGPVADLTSRDAVGGFAAALFGHDRVENALVVAPALPEGWPGRVLAGVEALALMKEGRLEVTAGGVTLEGWAASAEGRAKAEALLAAEAPGRVRVAVRFDAAAAAAEAKARALVEDPAGACARALATVRAQNPIGFEPGAAVLDAGGGAAVAALAAVFADCPPLDFEIGGHTDSAGAAERNQALSEARAEAVRIALEAADLPHIRFRARGYGAERPIAENTSEDGRAANRRIEFTLLDAQAAAPPFPEPSVGPR
jgi:OOP family OmpA-OmpF porin